MIERRLWREPAFDLMGKVPRINWPYVLLLCALAAVGYTAL
jgi:rod shape determining protein RodA